jgi:hypothetical protein
MAGSLGSDVCEHQKAMKLSGNMGLRLLGVWLVLEGVLPLLGLRIPNSSILLTVLAVVAGVLLLLDR